MLGESSLINETTDTEVIWWLNEIDAAKKREKDFRKDGQDYIDIYEGKHPEKEPFNILYSNTETLVPALYSAIPRPVVSRRYKDEDPLGKLAAQAGQRCLEFLLDTNIDGYDTFHESVKASVMDALIPGRGIVGIKYDADIQDDYKKGELVCPDIKSWNKVYFGYAKKWSKVPWVAYEECIDKEEAKRLFGEEIARQLKYTVDEEEDEDTEERNKGERKTATIYQIWDKDNGRKIRYVSAQIKEKYLKVDDDSLELTGFFNCPRPLQFVETTNSLLPVSIYRLYKNQAKELNRLTIRINRIIESIKARGAYDGALGDDIKNIMQADDNELVPADKSSSLAAEKGLGNAIWFMPVEKLIVVLQQLYIAREACKQVIYEITGIADVMRGQSKASETLGAQEIKTQWGTLRIKPKQSEVARYCRDILRMMLEIAATKFSEETWSRMTGLPFLMEGQRQQLQMQLQMIQKQIEPMLMQQQEVPPEAQQQMQQLQEQLQNPDWKQVIEILSDDLQRAYRIDIETNSTLEPEAAEDQKHIAEFMTAMGQFLNGVGPLVAQGVMPFEIAQTMLLTISRRFRFGDEIEDEIAKMKAPEKDDGADKAAAEAEQQKLQAEQAMRQAELETTQKIEMAKHAREQQAEQDKMQLEQMKIQSDERQTQMKLAADREIEMMKIEAAKKENIAKLAATRNVEEMKAHIHQQTELRKAAIAAAASIKSSENSAESEEPVESESYDAIQSSIGVIADALVQLSAPKTVERDGSGKIVSISPKKIIN